MVDAKSVNLSLCDKIQDEFMGLVERRFVLLAQCSKIVDVEKAAVVDVIGRSSPLREAIGLSFDEFVQRIEAAGVIGTSVNRDHVLCDEFCDLARARGKCGQTTLLDVLFTGALDFLLRCCIAAIGEMTESGDDALQFKEIFVGSAEFLLQTLDMEAQDTGVFVGRDRKPMLVVKHAEFATLGVEAQLELCFFKDVSILLGEYGDKDLSLQFIFDGIPID